MCAIGLYVGASFIGALSNNRKEAANATDKKLKSREVFAFFPNKIQDIINEGFASQGTRWGMQNILVQPIKNSKKAGLSSFYRQDQL